MKSNSILGISFQEETFTRVLGEVKMSWQAGTRLRIATVNPEFLVATEQALKLKENLRAADIKVVDGIGLYLALYSSGWQGERITGIQLAEQLLRAAENEKRSVLVILKKGGLSSLKKTREILSGKYPNLSFTVLYHSTESLPPADLTLIALGIPEQEYVAEKIESGVVIGVGGAIDFLTRAQKRAPKIFQTLGLEWFWRLLLQPKRFKRIWNAVVIFPIRALAWYTRNSKKNKKKTNSS